MKVSKLANRMMFVSPTVQAGWEGESLRSDFEQLATLGQGSYGVVWKARHKKTGAVYAIKEIKKKTIGSQKMLDHVRTEVKILYCLNHPNIVKLYNHFEDDFSIYFVLEFAERGELYQALLNSPQKKFDEALAARYVAQIAQAIQYIHRLSIVHRDIKPQNILLSKDDEPKLADFGWSNFTHGQDKRQTYCGTLDYLAPEMVDPQHLHDHRVDIWSIGVLIYELCTGSSPFSSQLAKGNLTEAAVKANITTLNYRIPAELSPACRDLITKILVLDPEERPSLDAILAHPWLTKATLKTPEEARERWLTRLKHEFGVVLENGESELKKFEAFSKEEIYNCCRLESVISAPKKGVEQGDKRTRQLELKVKELELCNRRQEEELRFLRSLKVQHQQCTAELAQAKETAKLHLRKMEALSLKLQDYERIIRDYEKSAR